MDFGLLQLEKLSRIREMLSDPHRSMQYFGADLVLLVEFSCSVFEVTITKTHAGAPMAFLANSCMCVIDVQA